MLAKLNKHISISLAVIIFALLFPSCESFYDDAPVPAFIVIDSISMVDNPAVNEGSLSHNIVDAWVFVNEDLVGIFELPCEVPVLDEGPKRVLVGPGIQVSASSSLRDNYLFYDGFETNVELVPGEKVRIEPRVSYRNEDEVYEYDIVEEFDDSFLDMQALESSQAPFLRTTEPGFVFEGSGSGRMDIVDTTQVAGFRTTNNYEFPTQGKTVYLEFDYRTDYYLVIGLQVDNGPLNDQTLDYLTLRPSNGEWRKVYVALTALIAEARNFQRAYVFFVPELNTPERPESGTILIDNVKLMVEL